MPSFGSVYLRDVSGHSVAIDASGFLYVNVNGTLSVGSVNVSGQAVATSGQTIAFAPTYSGAAALLSGLQVVTTVNSTTNISGNVVNLSSGVNLVQIASGFNQVTISGGNAFLSGLVAGVSGQTVTVASGAVPNISGQTVTVSGNTVSMMSGAWLASGIVVNISGQNVVTSVNVGAINITSGNIFVTSGNVTLTTASQANISGTAVVISGLPSPTTLSGTALGVSGQTVSVSSGVWLASGITVLISGQPVTVAVTTNVSGNVVYTASGFNLVQFQSGFNNVTVSGFQQLSGIPVGVSGQSITIVSGSSLLVSGGGVVLNSGTWLASGIQPNISGQAVSVSGDSVTPVRGNPTMCSGFGFSGALIAAMAMYDASGANWVPLSATISGSNNNLQVSTTPATKIFVGFSGTVVQSGMTSNSGGDPLVGKSGSPIATTVFQVTVRNLSGNNTVYLGGSGARPYSGFGFPLYGGDGLTQQITDASLVYVFATTSGQFLQWIGSQY